MNSLNSCPPNKLRRKLVALAGLILFVLTGTITAGDGQLEINQECALVGCFPGDSANFPVTISQAGGYVLTGDLSVSGAFTDGIEITADGVVLDLNGFTIAGSDDNPSIGISLEANEITIRNGIVRDFSFGVNRATEGSHGASSRVTGVSVLSSLSIGIRLGHGSLLADCSVRQNGQNGIIMDENSIVRGCTVTDNGSGVTHAGILVGTNSLVTGNTVVNNQGDGIFARAGAQITNNTVALNGADGIEISIGAELHASIVRSNTSSSNANYGIASTGSTLIINNAVNDNRNSMDNVDIQPCGTCTIIENHDL